MRFAKFGTVGLINTAVAYAAFLVLALGVRVEPPTAHAVGWVAGMATSWTLNRRWTFGDRRVATRAGLVRFVVANSSVMGAGALAVALFAPGVQRMAAGAGISSGLALSVLEAAVLVLSVVVNYVLATLWVFRSEPPGVAPSDA